MSRTTSSVTMPEIFIDGSEDDGSRLLPRAPPSGDQEIASRDHRRDIGGEIEGCGSHFLGARPAPVELCRGHSAVPPARVRVLGQALRDEWSLDPTRANAVEPHAGVRMVEGQRLAEPYDGELGRRVGQTLADGDDPANRRQLDDAPMASREHSGDEHFAAIEDPPDIDRIQAIEVG